MVDLQDDFELIEFLSVFEEGRWQAKQWRVVNFVDALELKTCFDEPDEFLLQIIVRDEILCQLDKVFFTGITFPLLVQLVGNAFIDLWAI
jgi:hypothetical protein